MPLKVSLGIDVIPGRGDAARRLLKKAGAVSTKLCKTEPYRVIEGIFQGIATPNGARADLLVDWLENEMKCRVDKFGTRIFRGMWIYDVEKHK